MVTTSLIALNYRIDIVMLEEFNVDFILIGLFAAGVSLAEYSWLVADIFKEVLLNKNTKRDEIGLTSISLRIAFSSVMIFAFFFIVFGKFLLVILFGTEFEDSYLVTVTMFLAVPFMGFVKIIGTLFIAQGRWMLYFKILFITVLINVFLNIVFIPKFKIFGTAIASVFSYMFCGLSCLYWYSKMYKISIFNLFIINKKDIKLLRSYF